MGGEQGAGREARRGTRREGAVPQAVPMGAEPSTEHPSALLGLDPLAPPNATDPTAAPALRTGSSRRWVAEHGEVPCVRVGCAPACLDLGRGSKRAFPSARAEGLMTINSSAIIFYACGVCREITALLMPALPSWGGAGDGRWSPGGGSGCSRCRGALQRGAPAVLGCRGCPGVHVAPSGTGAGHEASLVQRGWRRGSACPGTAGTAERLGMVGPARRGWCRMEMPLPRPCSCRGAEPRAWPWPSW